MAVQMDDLLLRVCSLTDPPRSAGKQNLTVRRLPALCEQHGTSLYEQVQHDYPETLGLRP